MKLNVTKVLKEEAKRAAMVKPLPKVRVVRTQDTEITIKPQYTREVQVKVAALQVDRSLPAIHVDNEPVRTQDPAPLLSDLNAEFIKIKKQRAILSSQIAGLVQHVEAKLRAETPALADLFLEGRYASPELEQHAAQIEALTDQGARIFDDIRYVELNGKLPAPKASVPSLALTDDVKAVHHDIRRLDDLIHKTRKKMESGKQTKNPQRKAMWIEKIAFAEAERTDLKHKLKKLQYEARAERTGE